MSCTDLRAATRSDVQMLNRLKLGGHLDPAALRKSPSPKPNLVQEGTSQLFHLPFA